MLTVDVKSFGGLIVLSNINLLCTAGCKIVELDPLHILPCWDHQLKFHILCPN